MRYGIVLLVFFNLSAGAQALQDINYSFHYDPTEPFSLNIKPVRTVSGWTIHFDLVLRDTALQLEQYRIVWDMRTSLSDKEGVAVDPGAIQKVSTATNITGQIQLPVASTPQIITAIILNNTVKRAWVFYRILDPTYPVNAFLTSESGVVAKKFTTTAIPLSVNGEGSSKIVSYYNDDFPAAVPAFSEGMGRVARTMEVDSTYIVAVGERNSFAKKGLYLIQKDTSDTEGFAFRAEDDYPRFTRIENLADPLIYVCTKQEFDKIKAAKGEKKAFDRVILSITGNSERARNFMRNYFKRVEWANLYFTSYKEGWKTDRGMIYILFGLPEELYKFSDREVWTYKSNNLKETFTFVKSSTIFDPDNYVLIRQKKFQELWYEKVDLWRNARF